MPRRIEIGAAIERQPSGRRGRVEIYIEPRDIWFGVYVATDAVYVCPMPLLVFRISRGRGIVS